MRSPSFAQQCLHDPVLPGSALQACSQHVQTCQEEGPSTASPKVARLARAARAAAGAVPDLCARLAAAQRRAQGLEGQAAAGGAGLAELQAAVKQLAPRLQAAQRRAEASAAACAHAHRAAAGAAAEASALRRAPVLMFSSLLVARLALIVAW